MEISLNDLKSLFAGANGASHNDFTPWLGKKVFIRTVTHHYTGLVNEIVGNASCMLVNAAWIADSGRFADALKSCNFDEVEPYPGPVQINYGAVIDVSEIGSLPKDQK